MFKLSFIVFLASIGFLLLVFILVKDSYVMFIPICVLYFLSAFTLLILNYLSNNILQWNIRYFYILNALLSILSLPFFLGWLRGSDYGVTFVDMLTSRKEFFSIFDPYTLACILTYILIIKDKGIKK